ncbi:TIM22 inner membrane protein import complex subunit Tim54 [Schizosaccharomyces cryophilus OY26]|uniref:Mitochondrial import inner membrane translocase subunit TIM54 n=1 Tax=Schizosaccharomyces cryophilus (strain OY26 / ATCC MYA-4695 / CBS 11777 / NBRC 106824 / NRRL Y48691) TaxID=653667 RepID=S9XIS1_SCHCR|nr:TIM22 inner membrane protein import complex subunit Tim54 [Schizosaccharomyces cryophilus OY26]EPY53531.1 TIM22 inner membrane protein import complex subunit Tim54 [Schizosaccharomyces cryophilus OY26]
MSSMLNTMKSYLPGRNMSIFLGVVGCISGGIYYDTHQRNLTVQKYCSQVAHLSKAPLEPQALPRKVRVYLHGPPGDGIWVAREEFEKYVRPILNAAAVDFEVFESKGEGNLLEQIARSIWKKRNGISDVPEAEKFLKSFLKESEEPSVNLLFGRHALKEFLYGIKYAFSDEYHEKAVNEMKKEQEPPKENPETTEIPQSNPQETNGSESSETSEQKSASPAEDISLSRNLTVNEDVPPGLIDLVALFPLPHLLGFTNTPKRIYRFFKRRYLAEELGEITKNVVLNLETVPFPKTDGPMLLQDEEADWPKQYTAREHADGHIWTAPFMENTEERRFFQNLRIYKTGDDYEDNL